MFAIYSYIHTYIPVWTTFVFNLRMRRYECIPSQHDSTEHVLTLIFTLAVFALVLWFFMRTEEVDVVVVL